MKLQTTLHNVTLEISKDIDNNIWCNKARYCSLLYKEAEEMCVLCSSEFVMQVHWTDQKISNREASSVTVGNDQLRTRQRGRHHLTRLANQILLLYGLKVEDWHGSKYLLSNRKGNSEIIHDLGGLWPRAEKLLGRKLDPLDPVLIEKLTASNGGKNG